MAQTTTSPGGRLAGAAEEVRVAAFGPPRELASIGMAIDTEIGHWQPLLPRTSWKTRLLPSNNDLGMRVFVSAELRSGGTTLVSAGCAETPAGAAVRCIAELAERYSAAKWPALRTARIAQTTEIDAEDWVTGEAVRIPVSMLVDCDRETGRATFHSAGVAAGRGVEDATRSGLLELLERDALARCWYGKGRLEPLGTGSRDPSGWRTAHYLASMDCAAHTAICVTSHAGRELVAIGAATALTVPDAALHALDEAVMLRFRLPFVVGSQQPGTAPLPKPYCSAQGLRDLDDWLDRSIDPSAMVMPSGSWTSEELAASLTARGVRVLRIVIADQRGRSVVKVLAQGLGAPTKPGRAAPPLPFG